MTQGRKVQKVYPQNDMEGLKKKCSNIIRWGKKLRQTETEVKSLLLHTHYKQEFMDSVKLKEEIGQYIQHADERFLQLVHGMIKADQTSTVGYQPDGTPITKHDLIARAQASEEDIKKGRVKSLKALKEEVKHW